MIVLGTLFSGIGAIEQALLRLGIEHRIAFACDNGDVEVDFLQGEELDEYKRLKKMRSKKLLKEESDIRRLAELNDMEAEVVDHIREVVFGLPTSLDKKRYVDELYRSRSRHKNFVKESYLANYDVNENDFHLDVRFFDGSDYANQVDILVGGSPCQSFSTVGAQCGLTDTRGTLFYEFARIVQEVQPKVFIYENVRGLTTHDDGKTWDIMQRVFRNDLNYRITEPQVLNACDYGIPQNRRRIFVIGIRNDLNAHPFTYPQPIDLHYTMQDFLEDNCAKGHFTFDHITGAIVIDPVPGKADDKFTLTPAVQQYVLAGGTAGYQTSTETDLPIARTLMKMMTQHHRAGVDNYITVRRNPLRLRQLSDREALRLMGFPDSFEIVVSSMQMLRQAGNSIVVDVLMAIVREIYNTGVFEDN